MSSQNIAETQKLIKLVEKLPFTEKDKKKWLASLHDEGIDDVILEEVQEKFHKIPADKLGDDWSRAKNNMELMGIIKRWRLTEAGRNFHRTR